MMAPGKRYIGAIARTDANFVDDAGDYVDPATIICKTMSPCGTEATYTMGVDNNVGRYSLGRYFTEITPNEAGRWFVRWTAVIGTTPVAFEDDFIVQTSPFFGTYGGDYA